MDKKLQNMENVDPAKIKKFIDLAISILTAIGGFLVGMGSASAANIISNL